MRKTVPWARSPFVTAPQAQFCCGCRATDRLPACVPTPTYRPLTLSSYFKESVLPCKIMN
ncbi:hypothetical protein SLEP1_g56096 [Rubroshorea leprosula]|uniref:Uncharacterized protein n=1 Tax=Rubroshorea leprosula TaxID=152421 RepID=A0AAV5MHT0_9ROSI|nr:hypothetical protein SLEP1_g56096 [Rubroshorea leprosula]